MNSNNNTQQKIQAKYQAIYHANKAIHADDQRISIKGQNIGEERLTGFQKFWNTFLYGLGILGIGIAVVCLVIFLIV